MERFIASLSSSSIVTPSKFKIQYGEIYSIPAHIVTVFSTNLKSSMERFIELLSCKCALKQEI